MFDTDQNRNDKRQFINRILFIVCTMLLLTGCYTFAANVVEARRVEALSDKVLRFHVIAKSDSEDDQRRKLLLKGLDDIGLECFEPEGAFYVFPNIGKYGLTSEEFCEKLL